jgi:hypothetical protein
VRHEKGGIMLAVSVQSFGKVIGFADENSLWDLGIRGGDDLKLAYNMIEWLATPVQYEHEIFTKLEAPTHLLVNISASLNATVCNRGLNNETNVQLSVLINGSVADSVTVSELLVGSAYTLSYQWTPAVAGTYDVIAYSPPRAGENDTVNNAVGKTVRVGERAWLGDLDGDFDVDEDDLWYFCSGFINYYKTHVKDPKCDFDNDCDIDEDDLWTFCSAFIQYYKAQ